jgi:hypothetical protein
VTVRWGGGWFASLRPLAFARQFCSRSRTDPHTAGRHRVNEIASAHADAPNELNFLHEEDLDEVALDNDEEHLLLPLRRMRGRLAAASPANVVAQYTSTYDALNRMRQQLSRPSFSVFVT